MIRRALILVSASLVLPAAAQAQAFQSSNTIIHRVMGVHPQAAACYRAAGALKVSTASLSECDEALERTDLEHGDWVSSTVNRGVLKYRLSQYDSAISDFDAVLARNPDHPEALIDKGLAIIASGRSPQSALPLFNAGLVHRPDASVGYYGRAAAYEMSANYKAAYQDYQRAGQLSPTWSAPKQALSRFLVR